MSLQTLPYLLVYFAAFVVSVFVFFYSWRNRTAPGVRAFAISVALEISWLVGYIIEINVSSVESKIFWDNFQFIGAFFAPIALLLFALGFTGRKVNERWLSIGLGAFPALILLAIFTNLWPELIRLNTQVISGIPYDELTYDYGAIVNFGNYSLYLLSLSYIVALATGFRRNKEKNFRTQLWLVLTGTGIPIAGLILAQFLGWKFANQRDVSPLFFVISNAVIVFGVFRFRIFNILPVAREALFGSIEDILIILDTENKIVDANPSARQFLSTIGQDPIGVHIGDVFPDLFELFGDVSEIRTEITGNQGETFDLRITPLYDRTRHYLGRLINAHDITQQKTVELEMQATNEQNQRRALQFQAIANVANATTTLQSQEATLAQIAQTISSQLGHYHTGIFLLDDFKQYAVLRAANSSGGQRMLEREHRLEVGAVGIVGNVAESGTPRIALDTGADAVYFDNPDLPDTRSEIALPLMIGSEVIGVLDVQSTFQNAFSQDDIDTLSILANQVSVTIQNTRLYEENIAALENAEKAYRQLTGESWKGALRAQTLKGFIYDGVKSEPLAQISNESHSIAIPVQIRGEPIGTIKLDSLDPGREWTEDEITLLQAAADRAALALESARLLEDAQRRANRERIIGEISTSVSASTDMEEILRNAVQELGRKMGGAEVVLELGIEGKEKESN